ncbi:MAG: sulfatase-like hydrolase/transferase, partial [Planctomycetota bacterium]|nr:sulfatase-like hydrolase/transferase [Planctomycetota bacterium]
MNPFVLLTFVVACCFLGGDERLSGVERPNVILILCDDLNDYVEPYNGHPQTQTPNIGKLARAGVTFTQAHCNIPICGPS